MWRAGVHRRDTAAQATHVDLINQSKVVRSFETVFVPGLLQVPDYARARLVAAYELHDIEAGDIDEAVALHLRSQQGRASGREHQGVHPVLTVDLGATSFASATPAAVSAPERLLTRSAIAQEPDPGQVARSSRVDPTIEVQRSVAPAQLCRSGTAATELGNRIRQIIPGGSAEDWGMAASSEVSWWAVAEAEAARRKG